MNINNNSNFKIKQEVNLQVCFLTKSLVQQQFIVQQPFGEWCGGLEGQKVNLGPRLDKLKPLNLNILREKSVTSIMYYLSPN